MHLHGGGSGFISKEVPDQARQVVLGVRQECLQLSALRRRVMEVLQHDHDLHAIHTSISIIQSWWLQDVWNPRDEGI